MLFIAMLLIAIPIIVGAWIIDSDMYSEHYEIKGALKKGATISHVRSRAVGVKPARRIETIVMFDDGFTFYSYKYKMGLNIISVDAELRREIIQDAIEKHRELYNNQQNINDMQ